MITICVVALVIVRLITHSLDFTLLSFCQYFSCKTNGIAVVVVVIMQVGVWATCMVWCWPATVTNRPSNVRDVLIRSPSSLLLQIRSVLDYIASLLLVFFRKPGGKWTSYSLRFIWSSIHGIRTLGDQHNLIQLSAMKMYYWKVQLMITTPNTIHETLHHKFINTQFL